MRSFFLLLLILSFAVNIVNAQEFTVVNGGLFDLQTKQPLVGINVHFISNQKNHISTTSNDSGYYEFNREIKYDEVGKLFVHGNVENTFSKNKYLNTSIEINFNPHFKANVHRADFYLQCSNCGEIPLPGIYFVLGKWSLLINEHVNSEDSLKVLLNILRENPNIQIELQSHTDTRGSVKANQILSQKRAEYCLNKLIEWGVDPGRLSAVGYGESIPIVGDDEIFKSKSKEQQEIYHAKNRRTSFVVTSFNYVDTSRNCLKFKFSGSIFDYDTKESLGNVIVSLKGTDGSLNETKSNNEGFYQFEICGKDRCILPMTSYTIEVNGMYEPASNGEKYLGMKAQESTVGILESTSFIKDFYLNIASDGCGGLLPRFPFDSKSAKLLQTDQINIRDSLAIMFQIMEDNPTIILEISGHTDNRLSTKRQEKLSQQRALVVREYLVANGVDPQRLIAKGYASHKPLLGSEEIENLTRKERKYARWKNNRVTFSVLSFDFKESK